MFERLSEAMGAAWSTTTSRQFHQKFHFTWKKRPGPAARVTPHGPKFTKHQFAIKTFFLNLELSQHHKCGRTFSSSEPVAAAAEFVPARPTSPSCAGARPQELGHWFCSQNLRLSSETLAAFGSDCQMTGRGSNLDSNSSSAADQRVVKTLSASKSQNNLCGVWILLRFIENVEIEECCASIPTLIH